MQDVIFYPAFTREVVTKFEKKNWKRFLPKTVRQKIDKKYFELYYVYQLCSIFNKDKNITPTNKVEFGEIKLSVRPRYQGKGNIDPRLEENKTYYGWKVECRENGSRELNLVLILCELTEAMRVFKDSSQKED